MTSEQGRGVGRRNGSRGGVIAMWGAAVAACAVCFAGPLLAVLAAVGVTAGFAAVAVPALAVVAVAAFGGVWWLRRRARARCAVPAGTGPSDLGIPTVGPPGERTPEAVRRGL